MRIVLTLLLTVCAIGEVRGYDNVCRITAPITELLFDPSTDTFTFIGEQEITNTNTRRMLRSDRSARSLTDAVKETISSWGFTQMNEDKDPIRLSTHRSLNENSNDTNEIHVQARYCDCFSELGVEPFYCPVTENYCGATPGEISGCFNTSQRQEIAINVLYVGAACLCAVCAWLICSEPGKHTRNYLIGVVAPSWNDRLASGLLRQHPERALHMMRIHLRHTHEETSQEQLSNDQEWLLDANAVRQLLIDLDRPWSMNKPEDKRRPVALKLKTCVYQSENESSTTTDEDSLEDCAICYQELISGERIGSLVCGHKLHSDCLKEWCARRNTCPLCNCVDIAEPQYINDTQAMVAELRRNLRI